jgi:hypothetical protein
VGAFFLFDKSLNISKEEIVSLYTKKGFSTIRHFEIDPYKLILCNKQLIPDHNYVHNSDIDLYTCGSLFYKGLNYCASLTELLNDFKHDSIDAGRLFGNYVLMFYNKTKRTIAFFIDPSFIKAAYYDTEREILSTDFLAIARARESNYSLNRLAIIESITTGNLITPDTYINEVERIDKIGIATLSKRFNAINFNIIAPTVENNVHSRKQAIRSANELLEFYFTEASAISNQYGAHIGLTGGFDSRLLLTHAKGTLAKVITNSFWRLDSKDYINAKQLAFEANLDFVSYENKVFSCLLPHEIIEESLYNFDGQIRSQNRWDQIFSLRDYTKYISEGHYVGFHGSGGEQYRNADHISRPVNFDDYVLNEWVFRQASDAFMNNNERTEVYCYIKNKVLRLTGSLKTRLCLRDIKKIQNEVWNTSNRTIRINVLNQQQFYFAPFTEYLVAQSAYQYVPFLGISADFQTEMIRSMDPKIAGVMTNYGYNLNRGEPFERKAVYYLASLFPRKVLLNWYSLYKRSQQEPHISNTDQDYGHVFKELTNHIRLSSLLKNSNLASGIFSSNFLLNHLVK